MFGWDFEHSKRDRVKLFIFTLSIFLVVGFTTYFFLNKMAVDSGQSEEVVESVENTDSGSSSAVQDTENDEESTTATKTYNQTEQFSEEQMERSKDVAIKFVKAYHTYNAEKPMEYLENAQLFMTDALYKKFEKTPRREPLERTYLTVDEIDITQVSNASSIVVRWNVMVKGEAKSVDGSTQKIEDWYLVGLRENNGEWLVEDVNVNVSS